MAEPLETPKIIPALAWYRPFEPLAYVLVRFGTGALIVPHGIDRLFYSGTRADLGFLAGLPASAVGLFEVVMGVLLAFGLLTRPVALLLIVEWIAIAAAVPVRPGASWLMLGATGKYPAFIVAMCFAFLLRGGGRYSLDHRIGREF